MTTETAAEIEERCAQARRHIAETIGTGDPSIVTNVIHALVTEHGDLTRLPREDLARLAGGAFRRLYPHDGLNPTPKFFADRARLRHLATTLGTARMVLIGLTDLGRMSDAEWAAENYWHGHDNPRGN